MSQLTGGWARVVALLIWLCSCDARPLRPGPGAGGITMPPALDGGAAGASGSAGGGAAGAGGAGGGATGAGGAGGSVGGGSTGGASGTGGPGDGGSSSDAGAALCPPVDERADPAPVLLAPMPRTQPPFGCQPLASTYFFSPPAADVPGQYSRCASYDIGAATSVAVSPDGALVALATADGIVRLVEPGSHTVRAVLASPRATIDYVAYAPGGAAIMTLARAQREVTLWRAGDWTPVWRMTLPGTPYYHLFGGGLAFSPDGSAAVASPGSETFLIDVATGAVLVQRASSSAAVLDVAYGWGGRRIIVAEPSLVAHCDHSPNGGTVTALDAATLAPVATLADLGDYGNPGGWRGTPQFRASPNDDFVLLPQRVDDPPGSALHALRLSDGAVLPAPALGTLPAAFMPDGSVLVADGGALLRLRIADGTTISATMVGDVGPMALSGNGLALAIGGSGANLLRVWKTVNTAPPTAACSADAPLVTGAVQKPASLSADGQIVAIATGSSVKVFHREGHVLANLPAAGSPYLSPSGALLAVKDPSPSGAAPAVVLRVNGGMKLGAVPYDSWNWSNFVFSPREDRLYSNGMRANTYRMDVVELSTDTSAVVDVPQYAVVLGTSNGCPVLYQTARGAWRSCGGCDDPPVGAGTTPLGSPEDAVLSADGRYLAIGRDRAGSEVTLWQMAPAATLVAAMGTRAGSWIPSEFPVAIASGGGRLLTGGEPGHPACYDGPQFEILVHDVATGEVIDHLPPGPAAVDAAARTIAYGAQLWCAR